MSVGWRKTWKCDLCGHYWLVVVGDVKKVPRQCPHCRKTQWHTKGDFTGVQGVPAAKRIEAPAGKVDRPPEPKPAPLAAQPWLASPIKLRQFKEEHEGREPESVQQWGVWEKWGR